MEPNKLDIKIKEQLQPREIQPSEMVWSKLDTMLTAVESSKRQNAKREPKRKFTWMYIAAGFAGFLLISTVYLKQRSNGIIDIKNEIVIQNVGEAKSKKENPTVTIAKDQLNEVIAITAAKKNNVANITVKSTKKSSINSSISNPNSIADVSINNQQSEKKSINSQSTAISVDELLAVAESKKEMQSQQNLIVKVNATTLLSEVDGELELSFREKIINKVSKNFQTVKVAVSNRNLE